MFKKMAIECLLAIRSNMRLSTSLLVASFVDLLVLNPCCEGKSRLFLDGA